VWAKEDFLTNTTEQLELVNEVDKMELSAGSAGDNQVVRMVVRQGGTYYASESSAAGSLAISDFANEQWGVLNTNDYTVGAFAPLSLTDIEAVGFTFDYAGSDAGGGNLLAQLNWNDFQVFATISDGPQPQPTVGSLSLEPLGSDFVISWDAGAAGTHTLQTRPDLVLGTWSNLVDFVPGMETTLYYTNTPTEATSFFRVIAE